MQQTKQFVFSKHTLLLLPVFYFLWFTVTASYDYLIASDDLAPHTGAITKMGVIHKQPSQHKQDQYFQLILKTVSDEAFIIGSSDGLNQYITSHLKLGDSVTIYAAHDKSKALQEAHIVKLIRNGETIMDFSKLSEEVSFKIISISLPLCLSFFALYFFAARRRLRASMIHQQ